MRVIPMCLPSLSRYAWKSAIATFLTGMLYMNLYMEHCPAEYSSRRSVDAVHRVSVLLVLDPGLQCTVLSRFSWCAVPHHDSAAER